LNDENLKVTPFAVVPADKVGGFGDIAFADDGSLLAMSFHSNTLFQFSATGDFLKEIKVTSLERPVGIASRDDLVKDLVSSQCSAPSCLTIPFIPIGPLGILCQPRKG